MDKVTGSGSRWGGSLVLWVTLFLAAALTAAMWWWGMWRRYAPANDGGGSSGSGGGGTRNTGAGGAAGAGAGAGAGTSNVDCSVSYVATSACEGDCWTAYQEFTGTVVVEPQGNGAPCPPLQISVSCNAHMPCTCRGADLPVTPADSVTTCNDCTYLQPGETCYLSCVDPALVMSGTPELMCANGTWAYTGLPPTCTPARATCPPIVSVNTGACTDNGVIIQPNATCVGALEGDVCGITCQAGYSIPSWAVSTAQCTNGVWMDFGVFPPVPASLTCAPQESCVASDGSGVSTDTCRGMVCPDKGPFGAPARGALLLPPPRGVVPPRHH